MKKAAALVLAALIASPTAAWAFPVAPAPSVPAAESGSDLLVMAASKGWADRASGRHMVRKEQRWHRAYRKPHWQHHGYRR